jgi:hypothetical protein
MPTPAVSADLETAAGTLPAPPIDRHFPRVGWGTQAVDAPQAPHLGSEQPTGERLLARSVVALLHIRRGSVTICIELYR